MVFLWLFTRREKAEECVEDLCASAAGEAVALD
jgi:hypothetical protein